MYYPLVILAIYGGIILLGALTLVIGALILVITRKISERKGNS